MLYKCKANLESRPLECEGDWLGSDNLCDCFLNECVEMLPINKDEKQACKEVEPQSMREYLELTAVQKMEIFNKDEKQACKEAEESTK